jgi:hypothetical protein
MKPNFFTRMRESRIDEILNKPLSGFIVSKGFRRFLCIVAVFFSYAFLANLLVPNPSCWGQCRPGDFPVLPFMIIRSLGSYAPAAMMISFLLLRRSMRRVTSLPDAYLDERERANRDWAFSRGYLVVRRIGLAVSIVFLIITAMGVSSGGGKYGPEEKGVEIVRALNSYLVSLTADAIHFYAAVVALLTYVAYSFPLILVAWRESSVKVDQAPAKLAQTMATPAEFATKYFRRLLGLGIPFAALVLALIAVRTTPGIGTGLISGLQYFSGFIYIAFFYGIFLWVLAALFVYVWATLVAARLFTRSPIREVRSNDKRLAVTFFTITQVLGLAVLVLMCLVFIRVDTAGWALGLGALMIPAQILSVLWVRKLGQAQTASEPHEPTQKDVA